MKQGHICAKCRAIWEGGKPDFRTLCPSCGAYLHTCINCAFYDARSHHECRASATTEYVGDKEKLNFCEEFRLKGDEGEGSAGKKSRAEIEKLFRDFP